MQSYWILSTEVCTSWNNRPTPLWIFQQPVMIELYFTIHSLPLANKNYNIATMKTVVLLVTVRVMIATVGMLG